MSSVDFSALGYIVGESSGKYHFLLSGVISVENAEEFALADEFSHYSGARRGNRFIKGFQFIAVVGCRRTEEGYLSTIKIITRYELFEFPGIAIEVAVRAKENKGVFGQSLFRFHRLGGHLQFAGDFIGNHFSVTGPGAVNDLKHSDTPPVMFTWSVMFTWLLYHQG
jgi:hypothetical protein